jgi:DNA-binding MarR family transcriptional regulator
MQEDTDGRLPVADDEPDAQGPAAASRAGEPAQQEDDLGSLLIELSPRITHLARHALRTVDPPLSYAQFRALRQIARGKTTLSALRQPATVALSTLSEIIDTLVKRGLLERTPSQTDRRVTELSLTDTGRRALADALQRLDALAGRLTSGLSEAAAAWLAETLGPVNEQAQETLVEDHDRGGRSG